ncbi:MAG: PrsW family glutamic-type intramembrane protease [Bacteroidales bacterium]|nr:PrsW family glutamic-type intramembrane protease [Bacteroidales bacterium]
MYLLILAIAPVLIIAAYIYYRDKYEREPIRMLLIALAVGMLTPLPIIIIENALVKFTPNSSQMIQGFYHAFVVAGFSEELFKYIALFLLIWKNKNFNEKFDGIVYATFISLGFAAVENVMYVLKSGEQTAMLRAITAVPAHALFGVSMGYYFGLAKFYPSKRVFYLSRSLIEPIILHGIYDFIIMSGNFKLAGLFVPYIIYLWFIGLSRMKSLSDQSIYRN